MGGDPANECDDFGCFEIRSHAGELVLNRALDQRPIRLLGAAQGPPTGVDLEPNLPSAEYHHTRQAVRTPPGRDQNDW